MLSIAKIRGELYIAKLMPQIKLEINSMVSSTL